MKKLLRFTLLMALTFAAVSCDKKDEQPEPSLDVTANNISGVWKLAEWSGTTLEEGTYVYIEFTRRDLTFTIYQNLDTFSARKLTGRYNINTDEELGAIIRGRYDYGTGDWAHRYIVRNLKADRMTWIATDDPEDISVYERCEAVPEEILADFVTE